MPRYIDADALRRWIENECKSPSCPRNEAAFGKRLLRRMELAPIVDAVLVVRCKDCKWRDNPTAHMWLPCKEIKPKNDWFCADGERKEGKQDE